MQISLFLRWDSWAPFAQWSAHSSSDGSFCSVRGHLRPVELSSSGAKGGSTATCSRPELGLMGRPNWDHHPTSHQLKSVCIVCCWGGKEWCCKFGLILKAIWTAFTFPIALLSYNWLLMALCFSANSSFSVLSNPWAQTSFSTINFVNVSIAGSASYINRILPPRPHLVWKLFITV